MKRRRLSRSQQMNGPSSQNGAAKSTGIPAPAPSKSERARENAKAGRAESEQADPTDAVEADTDIDAIGAAEVNEGDSTGKTEVLTEPVTVTHPGKHRVNWRSVLVYGVLPTLALLLAMAAGFWKWQDSSIKAANVARIESVKAAEDSTVALLSYRPDTVDRDLAAARDRLTGSFRDSYTQLATKVVIPGAKQKQITTVATVRAAGSMSANPNHAVVLVFVNQTVTVAQDPPTNSASTVRVTLEKIGGHWFISGFDPI
ncbi:hypothetical protein [Mycobacterium avium]|uniref:hypothetical protein n=1 Tax=Mycobacterium avium TaxID=1764 RepID=UPI001F2C475C|nr:hypothetical protein [Mycobacterium avium]